MENKEFNKLISDVKKDREKLKRIKENDRLIAKLHKDLEAYGLKLPIRKYGR